jgi:uncharacterized protein (DUF2236 family)
VAIAALVNPRVSLARAVRERIAGDFETQHAENFGATASVGSANTMRSGVCMADTSVFIGAIRALLLQSLHPTAMQAVAEHAGFEADFWGRFQRTSRYVALTTYGTIPDAERAIAVSERSIVE